MAKTLGFILLTFLAASCGKDASENKKSSRGPSPEMSLRSVAQPSDARMVVSDALAQGIREGKPVVVIFGAAWCQPCDLVKLEIERDPEYVNILSTQVVFTQIEQIFELPRFINDYAPADIYGMPAMFVFDPTADRWHYLSSAASAKYTKEVITGILAGTPAPAAELRRRAVELIKGGADFSAYDPQEGYYRYGLFGHAASATVAEDTPDVAAEYLKELQILQGQYPKTFPAGQVALLRAHLRNFVTYGKLPLDELMARFPAETDFAVLPSYEVRGLVASEMNRIYKADPAAYTLESCLEKTEALLASHYQTVPTSRPLTRARCYVDAATQGLLDAEGIRTTLREIEASLKDDPVGTSGSLYRLAMAGGMTDTTRKYWIQWVDGYAEMMRKYLSDGVKREPLVVQSLENTVQHLVDIKPIFLKYLDEGEKHPGYRYIKEHGKRY